jgi:hypothetical protein
LQQHNTSTQIEFNNNNQLNKNDRLHQKRQHLRLQRTQKQTEGLVPSYYLVPLTDPKQQQQQQQIQQMTSTKEVNIDTNKIDKINSIRRFSTATTTSFQNHPILASYASAKQSNLNYSRHNIYNSNFKNFSANLTGNNNNQEEKEKEESNEKLSVSSSLSSASSIVSSSSSTKNSFDKKQQVNVLIIDDNNQETMCNLLKFKKININNNNY